MKAIERLVKKRWSSFVDAFDMKDSDPFVYWVPEIRDIQRSYKEWWHSIFRKNKNYAIIKCEILRETRIQGVICVQFGKTAGEFGFVKLGKEIFFTSAKSLRLLHNVSKWLVKETDNFVFFYHSKRKISTSAVNHCDKIYKYLLKRLEIHPYDNFTRRDKVKYVFCRNHQEVESLLGIPLDSLSSVMDPVSLAIISTRIADIHEIMHAIAVRHIGGTPPYAYCEGFAECLTTPLGWKEFLKAPLQKKSVFSDLSSKGFYRVPFPWSQSGAFCKYIMHNFGVTLLKDIYKHTSRYTFRKYILDKTRCSVDMLMLMARKAAIENSALFEVGIKNIQKYGSCYT